MTVPLIGSFNNTPWNSSTRTNRVYKTTGNGTSNTFALDTTLLNGLQVGTMGQINATLKPRSSGAMKISGDSVIFDEIPANGATIIIPGQTSHDFGVSDQDDALGRTYTRVFYIADPSTIHLYMYKVPPDVAGIKVWMEDLYVGGAASSWWQLAPAQADGTAGTYASAGSPIYTPAILGQSYLDGASSALDGTIDVEDGSQFNEGDYLMINPTQGDQEILRISTISGNTLTVPTGIALNHADGSSILACGRKFFARITVPLNVAGGIPYNFFDVGLAYYTRVAAR